MTLFQTLQEDYKNAYKARDAIGKSALSYVLAQLNNMKIDLGREPTDDETIKRIQKEVKIMKETAAGFMAPEFATQYEEELAKIAKLEVYLPTMLSEAELIAIVTAKKGELGIADEEVSKNKGRLIGMIMKEHGAVVDGSMLNSVLS